MNPVGRWGKRIDVQMRVPLEYAGLHQAIRTNARAMHHWISRNEPNKAANAARDCFHRIGVLKRLLENK